MADSWWDDFSNNLATDLAPLVALFGEQPTKQYLSECLTLEDIIIFAAAPLGVIAAVVSAIRVCGTPSLRAFIGRAQEGAGTAEAELCSSTSRDVCELYSNGGIARIFGRPKLLEIVHDPDAPLREFYPTDGSKPTAGIYSFREYVGTDKGKKEWILSGSSSAKRKTTTESDEKGGARPEPAGILMRILMRLLLQGHVASTITRNTGISEPARFAPNPNLSLNIGIKPRDRGWFTAAAGFGITMQTFVLVWAGLTKYHYRWLRDSLEGKCRQAKVLDCFLASCLARSMSYTMHFESRANNASIDQYAFPMTVVGTTLLCFGMGLCAHLIESRTDERVYIRETAANSGHHSRLYWVQPGNQNIGDQIFDSFAYSDRNHPLAKYTTSFKETSGKTLRVDLIWTAVITTTLGFICQFLGLRACHSSVAVIQLGVTLIMSLVRAGLRTQRLRKEDNFMVEDPDGFEGHELDCLALMLVRFPGPRNSETAQPMETRSCNWVVRSMGEKSHETARKSFNTRQVDEHSCLQELSLPSAPGRSATLAGFRIKPQPTAIDDSAVNTELMRWLSERYHDACREDCRSHEIRGALNPNAATEAVFYRSRLARMTGLEAAETEKSSSWSERSVAVRATALILAQAIEDTMQILMVSDSQPPVTLHDSWEQAAHIFWTVNCSSMGRSEPGLRNEMESHIQMSLQRSTDQNGDLEGPWRAGRSEIEAVLSLWFWSLKQSDRTKFATEENSEGINQQISRILSFDTNREDAVDDILDLDLWRERGGIKIQHQQITHKVKDDHSPSDREERRRSWIWAQNALWWMDDKDFVTNEHGPPLASQEQRRFLGWYNVKKVPTSERISVLEVTSSSSLLLNCAQEIYCTFLTAALQAVKDIGGRTTVRHRRDGLTINNENIGKIQDTLIRRGLCDVGDAFACTIPVLRNLRLLTPPDETFFHGDAQI